MFFFSFKNSQMPIFIYYKSDGFGLPEFLFVNCFFTFFIPAQGLQVEISNCCYNLAQDIFSCLTSLMFICALSPFQINQFPFQLSLVLFASSTTWLTRERANGLMVNRHIFLVTLRFFFINLNHVTSNVIKTQFFRKQSVHDREKMSREWKC